jgi:hypothetical protein
LNSHISKDDLKWGMDRFYKLVGKYEEDNPDWLEAEIMRFFGGACHNLYISQDWEGHTRHSRFVSEEFSVPIGKPGEKYLFDYSVLRVREIYNRSHLATELSETFIRAKTHQAIEALVGPAAVEVRHSHGTPMLPVDRLKGLNKLTTNVRKVLTSYLKRPKTIILQGKLENVDQRYKGKVRLVVKIRIFSLVVNRDYNLAYYPIMVSGRIIAPRSLKNYGGLLANGLLEMIQAVEKFTSPEIFTERCGPRRGRWLKQVTEPPFEPDEYTYSKDFRRWSLLRPKTSPLQEKLTINQGNICKVLWNRLATDNSYMYYDDILTEAGIQATSGSRLHDQLRSRSTFLKRIIVGDKWGGYRLNVIRTSQNGQENTN